MPAVKASPCRPICLERLCKTSNHAGDLPTRLNAHQRAGIRHAKPPEKSSRQWSLFGSLPLAQQGLSTSVRYLHTNAARAVAQTADYATDDCQGSSETLQPASTVSLRKDMKDERRRQRMAARDGSAGTDRIDDIPIEDYELTVGIEIHAELNTARKLFSRAPTAAESDANPNDSAALFDLNLPGSQPHFQRATLVPAIRAALALKCDVQKRSTWDRKHYFYHDQPAGYQITQYYSPFAKDGSVLLYPHDGIAPEDGEVVKIGIKQVQMEQDTAKTLASPPDGHVLDFNRVSHPLIEIISLPVIHRAATAAAYVKKVQAILKAVDAVTAGMEVGGLRADVNVSVKKVRNNADSSDTQNTSSYSGITSLGQRTEIKNLSTFSSVHDAIVAERNRQIRVLEEGGRVEGETRGFSLGDKETRKLRSKEGEVDYRYMPDPDLPPLYISKTLVEALGRDLPALPDAILGQLARESIETSEEPMHSAQADIETAPDFGAGALTVKDAKTLLSFGEGERVDFFWEVLALWRNELSHKPASDDVKSDTSKDRKRAQQAANWVLHELGPLFVKRDIPWSSQAVPPATLVSILRDLEAKSITYGGARTILQLLIDGDERDYPQIIKDENLAVTEIDDGVYRDVARRVMHDNQSVVADIKEKGKTGKVMFLLGSIMKDMSSTEGSVQPDIARRVLFEELGMKDEGSGPPSGKKNVNKTTKKAA